MDRRQRALARRCLTHLDELTFWRRISAKEKRRLYYSHSASFSSRAYRVPVELIDWLSWGLGRIFLGTVPFWTSLASLSMMASSSL